jgi:pimeloyl-ACP methyl ester carboxylesterase
MSASDPTVVLAHGAWADGSSWSAVISALQATGLTVVAAPLPLTSLQDDVAALDRTLERVTGPVVLAGHAYAGGVIGATRSAKVRALVYIAALAPRSPSHASPPRSRDRSGRNNPAGTSSPRTTA